MCGTRKKFPLVEGDPDEEQLLERLPGIWILLRLHEAEDRAPVRGDFVAPDVPDRRHPGVEVAVRQAVLLEVTRIEELRSAFAFLSAWWFLIATRNLLVKAFKWSSVGSRSRRGRRSGCLVLVRGPTGYRQLPRNRV